MRGVMGLRGRLEAGAEAPAPASPRPALAEAAPAPPLVALRSWQTEQPVAAMHWLAGGVLAVATDLGPRTLLQFHDILGALHGLSLT